MNKRRDMYKKSVIANINVREILSKREENIFVT